MDKLTAIKIKYDDGTYSDKIPVSVLSENVEWDSTHTLVDILGSIDVDVTGTIQDQISQLFNEKISSSELNTYVANQLNIDVTNWLNNNVNPVGSAVMVDSSLSIEGAAADAKIVGDNIYYNDIIANFVSTFENFDIRNFVQGGLLNGNLTNATYRVSTKKIISYSRDLKISANTGFRFAIHTFSQEGTFLKDSGLTNKDKVIQAGTLFKISIAREQENYSEKANIYDFITAICFNSVTTDIQSSINFISKNINKNTSNFKMDFNMNFTYGSLSYGTLNPIGNYRISSIEPTFIDRDLYVLISQGFRCNFVFFDEENNYKNESFFVKEAYFIPKNSIIKISIAKINEDTSKIADINSFIESISFIPYIYEKINLHEKQINTLLKGSFTFSPNWETGGYNIVVGNKISTNNSDKRLRSPIYNCQIGTKIEINYDNNFRINLIELNENDEIIYVTNFTTTSPLIQALRTKKYCLMFAKLSNDEAISIEDGKNAIITIIDSDYNNLNSLSSLHGKNYINTISDKRVLVSNVYFNINPDNSITINGTASSNIDYYLLGSPSLGDETLKLQNGSSYLLSFGNNVINDDKVTVRLICPTGSDFQINITSSDIPFIMGSSIKLILRIYSGASFDNYKIYPMIRNIHFDNQYQMGWDNEKILSKISQLEPKKLMRNPTIPQFNQAMYNGIKFTSEIDHNIITNIGENELDYSFHDGTLLLHNNILYAIYCKYTGSSGDAAVNPNAKVCLNAYNIDGTLIFNKIIAEKETQYDTYYQTGGAGSPNAIIINDNIYILYTSFINNTYCEMLAIYNLLNNTITYHQILINNAVLDNAWINTHYNENYSLSEYTSAQCNSTIAKDDDNNYYIGWVCGTGSRGKAIIFKTVDFINWDIFYEYNHEDIMPVYEMPLGYFNNYLYYAIRPSNNIKGILGKIRINDRQEEDYIYYPNCSSRPLFFSYQNVLYFGTNPLDRASWQLYLINQTDLYNSSCVADSYLLSNYFSFACDENNNIIYTLRSDNHMQICKFTFILSTISQTQYQIASLLGFTW